MPYFGPTTLAHLIESMRAQSRLPVSGVAKEDADPDKGRRQFAYADEVSALPDRWMGYDAVDLVVLGTGKRDFVLQLAQDSESARRSASR
jgi:hypothetical protein